MLKKLKSKKVIIVSIMIMLTSVLMLSYASFVVTTNDYKASELLVSELTYSLTIYDENNNQIENPIVIDANTTKIYNVVVRSINKIDSKYTLAYNSQENLTVKYSNRTSWSTEDYIKDYNSKEVRIVVENKSNEERNVEIKIFGGYRYNDYIKIDTKGYTRITEEYDEELLASSELLNEIVKEETKCNNDNCLYGGGNKSNYLRYSDNLYRIIGTYNINNESVTKIISENITPSTNIKEDLNSIYNSLEDKEEIIYKTNKFNCSEYACTENTDYNNIGLLTKYEYELVGGENSYLKSNESYYVLNENNIETQNGSETGGLKPVIYLPSRTRVTGSGTISDPYKILTSDINIIAYTYNGQETDIPYETLKETKAVNKIECEKGTTASWDGQNKKIIFENVQVPEYCTINFVDGYTLTIEEYDRYIDDGKKNKKINSQEIISGDSIIFTPTGVNGKEISAVKCNGNAKISIKDGLVKITNVNASQTCIIYYQVSVLMTSYASPDTVNDNSSPCYIIAHGIDNNSWNNKDWDGTAKVLVYWGYVNVSKCKIISSRQTFQTNQHTPGSVLNLTYRNNTWINLYGDGNYSSAKCAVTIYCDQYQDGSDVL